MPSRFSAAAWGGEIARRQLISSRENVRIETARFTPSELAPRCPIPWAVEKSLLHGGRQEGVDLVEVRNGKLEFRVAPTRGMGLLDARMGDLRLGWDSPIREVVHPRHVRLESRGGLGWLEGFNEWVVRCGLEFAGAPGRDRFTTNTGEQSEMDLTLHGKIANLPASELELLAQTEAPYRIGLVGQVEEKVFFGPLLRLESEVSTLPGSSEIHLRDRVANLSSKEQEFQLLYHVNLGGPLLQEGACLVCAAERVFPLNERAAEGIEHFNLFPGPTPGFVEQVYGIFPCADASGWTAAMLRNRNGDRGMSLRFNTAGLPFLTLWKNTAALEDGYVVGLEPATGFPFNRSVERRFGRVPCLSGGEDRGFELEFSLLDSREAVEKEAERIEALQKPGGPVVDSAPPKLVGK